jgi:excisionase family DNA binding protein
MSVARAVLAELASDPQAREQLRLLIAPMFEVQPAPTDAWLGTKGAAEYLGISTNALHKHTSARTIRFHQDVPGGKCWFRRSELDAWRAGG